MKLKLLTPLFIIFVLGLAATIAYPVWARGKEAGNAAVCRLNMREVMKHVLLYGQNFGRGVPRIRGNVRGTANLQELLFGTWNGIDRSPENAVLKTTSLLVCRSDGDVRTKGVTLKTLRYTATPENFHEYTSYVVADQNLTNPGGDQIIMADDAENAKTKSFWSWTKEERFDGKGKKAIGKSSGKSSLKFVPKYRGKTSANDSKKSVYKTRAYKTRIHKTGVSKTPAYKPVYKTRAYKTESSTSKPVYKTRAYKAESSISKPVYKTSDSKSAKTKDYKTVYKTRSYKSEARKTVYKTRSYKPTGSSRKTDRKKTNAKSGPGKTTKKGTQREIPDFRSYDAKRMPHSIAGKKPGGVTLFGDFSVLYIQGQHGVVMKMLEGNPKAKPKFKCYY